MDRKIFIVVVLFFFGMPVCLSHGQEDRSKRILDNGLTVLMTEMPSSPVVSVYALVKAGSATEGPYLGSGISHFLEHMLFKGTHEQGVGEIAARIQAAGGTINASTGMDYTIYTITVPVSAFDVALETLANMLMRTVMDPVEVERERDVIIGEMRLYNDNPDRKIGEWTYKNVFLRHPYGHPIIGYEDLLRALSREDLDDYYRTFYVPNNIVFSVAGNINAGEIFPKIQEAFKNFKRGRPVLRNLPEEPFQITPRYYSQEYPTDLTRLSMSFLSVGLLHPDLYALDVLANILGQGESSRLYLDVYKKKGLVREISVYNYTPMDKGLLSIDCLLDPQKTQEVIAAVMGHIRQMKEKGVEPAELEKAKQQVRSDYIFDHQTSSSVAYAQAVDEAFAGDARFSKNYVEGVRRVTGEDIQRVAKMYLAESSLTTVELKPRGASAPGLPEEKLSAQEPPIQKFLLANGLRVLLREDHTVPVIAMQLVANGGTREEPDEINGLFQLIASVWTKGTKRYTARQIVQKIESLGMRVNGFSGRNSFGVSFGCLSDQFPEAMMILEDLFKNPAFLDEEIAKAKEDMATAIQRREDDIFQSTARAMRQTLFLTHPLRLDAEGTLESLGRITRTDVVDYYGRFAVPGNMVLSVFGDIDSVQVKDQIQKVFGTVRNKEVVLKAYSERPVQEMRVKDQMMDKEQAMVMMGFHGGTFKEDFYGLELLTSILGESFSGRLFTRIREQLGEAYTLGGEFIPGPDAGMIYFYVLTSSKNVENVVGTLKNAIMDVQNNLIPEEEFLDMKSHLKGVFRASRETSAGFSFMASLDELYGLSYHRYEGYDASMDQVTREDVRRLARQYLDLNKSVLVVTRPKGSTEASP